MATRLNGARRACSSSCEPALDETTVMRFRPLLKKLAPGGRMFEEVGRMADSA